MTSEEGWNFPSTLEGFGYAFNKGKRKIDFWKNKEIRSYICWNMDRNMMYKLGFLLLPQSSDHFLNRRNNYTKYKYTVIPM